MKYISTAWMFLASVVVLASLANAAAGGLDTTFNGTGKFSLVFGNGDESANASATQTDDKIIVGGGGGGDFVLVRYNTDGSIDTSFGIGGKVFTNLDSTDGIKGVAIQTDGKIIAVGDSPTSFAPLVSTDTNFTIVR